MRITEAKIRQVIREEILGLLKEVADTTENKLVGKAKFGQLLQAQENDESKVKGVNFAELQKLNPTTLKNDTEIEIYSNKKLNTYSVKIPVGESFEYKTISLGVFNKLKPKSGQQGNVAGLPANLRSLHGLKESIRRMIKEALSQQAGGVDYNRILNYLAKNWSGQNGYYNLLQENPKVAEEMKRQFAGQNGIKTVTQVQPPSVFNNMLYGSNMTFVANDGKTYKFNYHPQFSSLTDENGGILASTR